MSKRKKMAVDIKATWKNPTSSESVSKVLDNVINWVEKRKMYCGGGFSEQGVDAVFYKERGSCTDSDNEKVSHYLESLNLNVTTVRLFNLNE